MPATFKRLRGRFATMEWMEVFAFDMSSTIRPYRTEHPPLTAPALGGCSAGPVRQTRRFDKIKAAQVPALLSWKKTSPKREIIVSSVVVCAALPVVCQELGRDLPNSAIAAMLSPGFTVMCMAA